MNNKCTCDCHKKNAESELVKCRKINQRKTVEINQLKKKLLVATIALAVGGTFVGKEAFDSMLEYFQKYDKVKQAIDRATTSNADYEIFPPTYSGVSPSPSTLAVLGLYALAPKRRRR